MLAVGIIGAGPAGLAAIRQSLKAGCDVTAFEQSTEVGGVWVYTDTVGNDKYGVDIHTSMYKDLTTNIPKEIMCYPDFPIPDDEWSFLSSDKILKFFQLYADKFNLREHIKFEHQVIRVRPLVGTWEVIVRDLKLGFLLTYFFDVVMVCSGSYWKPMTPIFDGIDIYEGFHMHSHNYRENIQFKGERVLIIGTGPSGIDISLDVAKVADHVTLSHHLKEPPNVKLPANYTLRPDVEKFTRHGVVFADGTTGDYTSVIFCTGFKTSFPFLSTDCELTIENNYVRPLYQHCININYPTLAIIGLPFYNLTTPLFDLQVRFCLSFWSGHRKLPTKEEMLADTDEEMKERWARGLPMKKAHYMGVGVHGKYYEKLAKLADIEPLPNVMIKIFDKNLCGLFGNVDTFRKQKFRIRDSESFYYNDELLQ